MCQQCVIFFMLDYPQVVCTILWKLLIVRHVALNIFEYIVVYSTMKLVKIIRIIENVLARRQSEDKLQVKVASQMLMASNFMTSLSFQDRFFASKLVYEKAIFFSSLFAANAFLKRISHKRNYENETDSSISITLHLVRTF